MIDKLYLPIRRKTMPEGLMRNPYPHPAMHANAHPCLKRKRRIHVEL